MLKVEIGLHRLVWDHGFCGFSVGQSIPEPCYPTSSSLERFRYGDIISMWKRSKLEKHLFTPGTLCSSTNSKPRPQMWISGPKNPSGTVLHLHMTSDTSMLGLRLVYMILAYILSSFRKDKKIGWWLRYTNQRVLCYEFNIVFAWRPCHMSPLTHRGWALEHTVPDMALWGRYVLIIIESGH